MEQSIKFVNDKVIFLLNPIAELIQGENNLSTKGNPTNLQHNLETKDGNKEPENKNYKDSTDDSVTDNPNDSDSQTVINFVTDRQNQQQAFSNQTIDIPEVPQNQTMNKPQSQRTRIPTRYV